MANLPSWGNVFGIGFKWIDKTIDFFKKKGRRDAIQSMEKDVASDSNDSINKRLSNLEQRAKNKSDSQ